jgi:hypothetical protein
MCLHIIKTNLNFNTIFFAYLFDFIINERTSNHAVKLFIQKN